jgi:hypothetical protein
MYHCHIALDMRALRDEGAPLAMFLLIHSSCSTCFAQQACRTLDNPGSPNRVSDETLHKNRFTEPILSPVRHALH